MGGYISPFSWLLILGLVIIGVALLVIFAIALSTRRWLREDRRRKRLTS